MKRGLIALVLLVALVAVFALNRHHSTTVMSTTTTMATTTVSTPPTTTTTAAAAGTDCRGTDFSAHFNQGQGAAGTIYASITLTRTGTGSCTVKGFPILSFYDAKGLSLPINQIDLGTANGPIQFQPVAANRAPANVTLATGSSTTFSFAYNDVQTGTTACESAVTINVKFTRSGAAVPVTPAYPLQPCDNGRMWVSPFY